MNVSDSLLSGLPPLPELFGNPVLREGFVEIQPAASIDWRPQTPGWYVLGLLLSLWLARMLWRAGRRWLRNRYRREALRRLQGLGVAPAPAAVNEILKLAAMNASSREEVSRLSGTAWIDWLSARCEATPFSGASISLLQAGIYQTNNNPDQTLRQALRCEAQEWLIQHRDDHGIA